MPFPDELVSDVAVLDYDPRWPGDFTVVPCNVHVRGVSSPAVRQNFLFRDFLRADDHARDAWGAFKRRLAATATDLHDYGQIKAPATEVLMIAATDWARRTGWQPPDARKATFTAADAGKVAFRAPEVRSGASGRDPRDA